MNIYETMKNTLITTPENPYDLFNVWFEEAVQKEVNDPEAMSLATVGEGGCPSVRIVLFKGFMETDFTFYTNLESRKGRELQKNPNVALCFHWKSLRRQIRVEGIAKQVDDATVNHYFSTRKIESQIGAWASQQSRPLRDRSQLEESIAHYTKKFAEGPVPRPEYWSGFRVTPKVIEFWEEQPFRLHNRVVYQFEGEKWSQHRLYP